MERVLRIIDRLKATETKVYLTVFGILSLFLIFTLIAYSLDASYVRKYDEAILKFFRDHENPDLPLGPYWVNETMRDITALGGGLVVTLLTLFTAGYLILLKRYKTMSLLLFSILGGVMLSNILKEFFGRERPDVVLHLMDVRSLSFPSGHSMMSTVVYLSIGILLSRIQRTRKNKIYIISIALFLAFIIGVSRVYLGVHYPTDVLGGWFVGLGWALLTRYAASYISRRKTSVEVKSN